MPRGAKRRPINHGTPGGYQVHFNRGQEPCAACKEARRVAQAAYRAQNTPGVLNAKARNAAAFRARKVLSELHRAEYLKLYRYELEKAGLE